MNELADIVAEMRRLGVTKYKKGDIEVELGQQPHEDKVEDPQVVNRQLAEQHKKEADRRMRTMFGATSSMPRVERR